LLKNLSFRSRIFISMILLVFIASVLIVGVTIYQYREQTNDYHQKRLARKESQVKQSTIYTLKETTYPVTTKNLKDIFKYEIYQIADVQNVNFNIQLIKSSKASFNNDSVSNCLAPNVLNNLAASVSKRYVEENKTAKDKYHSSYSYILDNKFKPIGILNLPYLEDNSFNDKELKEFLFRIAWVYLFLLLIAIGLAYIISKYITRSLQTISDKINKTNFARKNKRIIIKNPGEEIGKLITSYNGMIDELEQSAVKLAKSEREQAWREMAKQVAHEIKNPLTPMRLSIQSFERKFDASDPKIEQKIDEYSKTLIQQIDTLSSIASAFSNFANMPAQQNETLNVVKIVKLALDIFNENYIHFLSDEDEIIAKLDRTQLIRVVTNLVKNAEQAIPENIAPKILVSVISENENVKIMVADNGIGIADDVKDKIFEPKFTTKSSGMGLGLGMVKNIIENYKGTIEFTSKEEQGTIFTVKLPKDI